MVRRFQFLRRSTCHYTEIVHRRIVTNSAIALDQRPYRSDSRIRSLYGIGLLSGLIGTCFENAQIDAVDISPSALEVAHINIENYGLASSIHLIHSDLFSKLDNKRYDLIISNPPYVNEKSMNDLPEEFRHEPSIALAGGTDGLSIVHNILTNAADFLNDEGLLIVEIGHNRSTLEHLYPRVPFTWLETSAGDQFVFMLKKNDWK